MSIPAVNNKTQHAQNKFNSWVDGAKANGHITDSNAQHLKKAFQSAITDHTKPQECIASFSKKIQAMKKHFKTPQITANLAKKTVEKILSKTQTSKAKKADTGAKTALFTAKIATSAARKKLEKIIAVWKTIAKNRYQQAQTLKVPAKQLELAEDSFLAIENLKKDLATNSVYIAYDTNKKVQAIALAKISKKKDTEVEFIATHPDNVIIFGNENAVRGAGTALMKHIAQSTAKKNNKAGIHLYSYKTAIPFYKKIGFTGFWTGVQSNAYEAKLSKAKMVSFLKSHKSAGTIELNEPTKFT